VIRIVRGCSRGPRPDLKQVIVGLLTTYRSVRFIQALDENAADAKVVPGLIKAYVQQFREEQKPYLVADGALREVINTTTLCLFLACVLWACSIGFFT